MKFLAIMGHGETRPKVRDLFRKYQVSMFSSMDIRGCNCDKKGIDALSWWPADQMLGVYSSLCFAIVDDHKADAIMLELEQSPITVDGDFPARAFLMNVEKTV
ncbi:MAG: hypothetical protein FDX30_09595 [Chlorobium sp.]|jgi:hypothetical protein|nr:MAG: hypothetical protein FDX30_11910 [Chlorobium sp.]TLU83286.1 MAG: hypothetical protein FDX30_09595 [Chlorobium sp.]